MNLLHIGLFVLGLFVGANLGLGLMCLLQANGPSADDALWHLGRLYHLMADGNMVTYPAGGVIDNVRRFLLKYGDD